MTRALLRALARPRALVAALVLGVLVSAPALATGWFSDDFVMRLLLGDGVEGYPLSPLQLYEFTPPAVPASVAVERGFLAWFTAPEMSLRFFRPLSSATLWLGAALFGRSALLAHLHQLLWFLALVVVVGRLHRRLLRPSAAGLATVLYAIASYHATSVAWIAARHVLVGGFFGTLTVLLHVGWRQTGERWRAVGAALAFGAGALASEIALCAAVLVVLYELLARADPGRVRARAAAPAALATLGYLAFYVVGGWGARHSGMYLSPLTDPLAYAGAASVRVPVLFGEAFGGVPSELWGVEPLRPMLLGWAALTTITVLLLLRAGRFGRRERWLLASSVAGLAPVVGGVIGGRLLVVVGAATSALLATAIVRGFVRVGQPGGWGTRVGLGFLLVLGFGLSPLARLGIGAGMIEISSAQRAQARALDVGACRDASLLYSLTGADPSSSMYLEPALRLYAPDRAERFETIRTLSMAVAPHRFTRVGERSFTLEILGEREIGPIEAVHYDEPPAVGSERTVGELTIEVTDGTAQGWTAARFEVDRPLESVCFASWDGEALRLWRAPPVGETRELPYRSGIMGM
ncbi:MAG TPA: hypothetical protein RMH99_19890 [Sandaracinaceae bacterium LLY-WYZ-13_1]|nr:hypothetical protein [Sandaracinaceae bacterium LLY-WYZ-13_1]